MNDFFRVMKLYVLQSYSYDFNGLSPKLVIPFEISLKISRLKAEKDIILIEVLIMNIVFGY